MANGSEVTQLRGGRASQPHTSAVLLCLSSSVLAVCTDHDVLTRGSRSFLLPCLCPCSSLICQELGTPCSQITSTHGPSEDKGRGLLPDPPRHNRRQRPRPELWVVAQSVMALSERKEAGAGAAPEIAEAAPPNQEPPPGATVGCGQGQGSL